MRHYGNLYVTGELNSQQVNTTDLTQTTITTDTLTQGTITTDNLIVNQPLDAMLAGTEGTGLVYQEQGVYKTIGLQGQFDIISNELVLTPAANDNGIYNNPQFTGNVTFNNLTGPGILQIDPQGQVSQLDTTGAGDMFLQNDGTFKQVSNPGTIKVYEHLITNGSAGAVYFQTHGLIPVDAVIYKKYQNIWIKKPQAVIYYSEDDYEVVWQLTEYLTEGKIVIYGY